MYCVLQRLKDRRFQKEMSPSARRYDEDTDTGKLYIAVISEYRHRYIIDSNNFRELKTKELRVPWAFHLDYKS